MYLDVLEYFFILNYFLFDNINRECEENLMVERKS